jgi:hypothetical protein
VAGFLQLVQQFSITYPIVVDRLRDLRHGAGDGSRILAIFRVFLASKSPAEERKRLARETVESVKAGG